MSQRNSGYDRKEADFYPTPDWVTRALVPFIPRRVRRVTASELAQQVADLNSLLADSSDHVAIEDQAATAAMLAKALAKKRKEGTA